MATGKVEPEKILAHVPADEKFSFDFKHPILYSLGLGYGRDPLNDKELAYVYENHENFKILPSFSNVWGQRDLGEKFTSIPGLPQFNLMNILHGEQYNEYLRPLKTDVNYIGKQRFTDIADKPGKGSVLVIEVTWYEEGEGGKLLPAVRIVMSIFIRQLTGYNFKGTGAAPKLPSQPKKNPDKTAEEKTNPDQAILYRLAGDLNPLHIDPNMAAVGGFDKPILHGLCFYGLGLKALVRELLDGNEQRVKSYHCRFTGSVFPGETIIYKFYKDGDNVIIEGVVKERNIQCLFGQAVLREAPKL